MAATAAQAQFYKGFGIKAGTTIATQNEFIGTTAFSGNNSDEYFKYKFGFTIGVLNEFSVDQNLKAQIGINYARKGTLEKNMTTDGWGNLIEKPGNIHINYDFLTTELYLKNNFLTGKIKPYILGGLRLDFYLSSNTFIRVDGTDTDLIFSNTHSNDVILGVSLGAGLEYQATKLYSVFFEGTYNPDFTYIISDIAHGRSFDIRTGIKF